MPPSFPLPSSLAPSAVSSPAPIPGLVSRPGSGFAPAAAPKGAKAPAPLNVSGMQKFLASHGYQIPVDGVNGPLTQAAAADFRGSRNPTAFNVGHGLAHGAAPTVVPGAAATPAAAPQAVSGARVPAATKPAAASPKPAARSAAKPASAPAATPASDTQTATAAINAIIAPIIKQIQDANAQQATQGQGLISGYTTDAMNALKGTDFGAPAAGAAGQENTINTALLSELQGQGSSLQNALGATLAKAGADPAFAAQLTGRVASDTAGAGGAGLAKGDATLSQLLSDSAAAKTYGEKLGPITQLAGAQDVSKLLGGIASNQKTQLGDIQAKVPGMVQTELSDLRARAADAKKTLIGTIMATGYDPTTGGLTPQARAALAKIEKLPASSFTGTSASTAGKIISTRSADARAAAKEAASSSAAAAKAAKPSLSWSKQNGYLSDSNGNPILRNGKQVPVSKGGKALTANEAATLQAKAEKDAEDLYWGVTKTNSAGQTVVVSHSVQYPEAVKTLVNRYPSLGLKGALKLANSLYSASGKFPDGTPNGRPRPTNSAKTNKAVAAGLGIPESPFAQVIRGGR